MLMYDADGKGRMQVCKLSICFIRLNLEIIVKVHIKVHKTLEHRQATSNKDNP